MKKHLAEAVLSAIIYVAVMWIAEDLIQGIGYDRILPTLLGGIVVALFVYLAERWFERRTQRKRLDKQP